MLAAFAATQWSSAGSTSSSRTPASPRPRRSRTRRWRCGTATWTSCRPAISWSAARRSGCSARRGSAGRWSSWPPRTASPPARTPAPIAPPRPPRSTWRAALRWKGREAGIRVNVVNPDAVLRGSKIWSGEWLDQRASTYKTDKDGLEEMYRQRSPAETVGPSRGYCRGGLFLRLGSVGQIDRQHPQRGCGQRPVLHEVTR